MKLPGQLQAEFAVKTLWLVAGALVFLALILALTVQTVRLEGFKIWPFAMNGWIETARTAETQRDTERTAHQATKDKYRDAQVQAARLEAERLKRVREQQEEITDAIEDDYRTRLADLGARAERLREELQGRTGAASPPAGERGAALRESAERADRAPSDNRLSSSVGALAAAGVFGRTPEEQLERDIVATRQALQLDALIDWVERQSAIDPNASVD
ncbi:MAG: hypothetical protein GW859_02630 [Sphingomonadales bacterium]|nr:hypothetical protein [Sphingomonadales bacterium]